MATINPADEVADQPEAKKQKLEVPDEVAKENVSEGNGTSESASTPEPSKLEQNIINQVEYYFGDSNLFRDKFLQEEITKNEGWISLTTLITFKRLAALSTDLKVIVDALDKSDTGLLEISEDRQNIRRHPERPLPEKNEETRKEIISRTAYVKGFPKELEMPDIIDFFKEYPKVSHVMIRKYLDKPTKTCKSKGSVFATFSTREQCAAFLSQDVKYKDGELITKWQSDYYADKKTERQEKQKEKNARLEPEIELAKGTVLLITDIKSEAVTRMLIRETFEALESEVAFVDFVNGDEKAYVRFAKENSGKDVFTKLENGKIKFGEEEAAVSVLEGEDEDKYLGECIEKIKIRRQASNNNRKKFNKKRPGRF